MQDWAVGMICRGTVLELGLYEILWTHYSAEANTQKGQNTHFETQRLNSCPNPGSAPVLTMLMMQPNGMIFNS